MQPTNEHLLMKKVFLCFFLLAIGSSSIAQNKVMSFDGLDDYLDLGDSTANGARTIEMWFQPQTTIDSTLSDFSYLMVREIGAVNYDEFHISFRSTAVSHPGALQFMIRDGNNSDYRVISNSNKWNADQWYHVAGVVDPIHGMMMFVDGVKQADTNRSVLAITSVQSSTTLGGTNVFSNRYFQGNVDDVRFSTTAEYTSNFTPSCPDLKPSSSTVGLWNFNGGSNPLLAVDSTNNANNAKIHGATFIEEDVCPKQYNVLHFDGVDDYLDLGDSVGNGIRTIEMWFQPKTSIDSTLSDFSYLVVREIGVVNYDEFHVSFRSTAVSNPGALQFMIRDGNNLDYRVISNSNKWNANQWYHVAAVVDPVKGMMLFIDGVKQLDTNNSTLATTSVNSSTTLGGTSTFANRYFNGNIDDVRFSTAAEYTSNFAAPCPDQLATVSTVGLWNFNGWSDDVIAADSSGNSNDATIYGAKGETEKVCNTTTSIADLENTLMPSILVYPNPSSGDFTFDLSNLNFLRENLSIEVYSILGKHIKSLAVNRAVEQFNLSEIANGLYFYRIISRDREITSGKLMKQ